MENKIIAICYDFDKTLSPLNMQEQGFIQDCGMTVGDFWQDTFEFTVKNQVESNLAYMFKMVEKSNGTLTKERLFNYGKKVQLFSGLESWFDRINEYGNKCGVTIEHYVISSGIKEIIEGTSISKNFKKIYASSFSYDEKGVANWPAQVINYTNKTQFLFRVEKGVLNALDDSVNDRYVGQKRIPFSNIVYIGDSDTDIPCMSLVKDLGGTSIGVYDKQTLDKSKIFKMIKDERISSFAPADYSENSELDDMIKQIINERKEK